MRFEERVFYHLYPLGAFGALDAPRDREPRLSGVRAWIPAMEKVGANALYLGPVFESERHGYDTLDYRRVDARLGRNEDLAAAAEELRGNGVALVLDAVFNHVGRGHPLVRDVAEKGSASPYAAWIAGYDPSGRGPGGLPFAYEGWKGHYDLVKLDTSNPEVRAWLVSHALSWMDEYGVAGLRLDAADDLDLGFLAELGRACRARDPEFFLIGEAVHGDHYQPLLTEGSLDSVTDYEAFKGLWSSLNDRNYFEIAWTLDRLFGPGGLCRGRSLYSFADNHDVDRAASLLRDPAGLYPLYGLLFAMPGAPSIYYGSEFGVGGRKTGGNDGPLRPALDPGRAAAEAPHPALAAAIGRFAAARRASRAVREGSYRQLAVKSEGMAFLREAEGDVAVVAVNGFGGTLGFDLKAPEAAGRELVDALDPGFRLRVGGDGGLRVEVPPRWLRWLVPAA